MPAALRTGDHIADRFVVEAVLGSGATATVYKVQHLELGTHAALKLLTHRRGTLERRMLTEGQVLSSLRHDNLLRVIDILRIDGQMGLVMDYIEGPTLEAARAVRPFTTHQLDAVASALFDGIEYAHDKGYVHRDLKPANVLLDPLEDGRYRLKIADFGLVKETAGDGATRDGALMGTPRYMSPEQVRNAREVDHRTDLYSLAVVLYEMVAGRSPFTGQDTFEILREIADGTHPKLADLPDVEPRMAKAVDAAMAIDPDDRVANVAVMRNLWFEDVIPPSALILETDHADDSHSWSSEHRAVSLADPVPETLIPDLPTREAPVPTRSPPVTARVLGTGTVLLLFGLFFLFATALAVVGVSRILPSTAPPVEVLVEVPVPVPAEPPTVQDPAPAATPSPVPPPRAPAQPSVVKPQPDAVRPRTVPPSPTLVPAPAKKAHWRNASKNIRVVFVQNGTQYGPGSIPAGTYRVRATFGDKPTVVREALEVEAGQRITVKCNAFKTCTF